MKAVRELTLHIGLPKTATTTLQTHVFPQLPGYLGKYSGADHPSAAAPRVSAKDTINQWRNGIAMWRGGVEAWVGSLEELSEPQLLLSHESLAAFGAAFRDGWSITERVGPHPVIEFIEVCQVAGCNSGLRVRVIVTLRNQPEFVSSLYAQLARWMRRPSQADFEDKVQRSSHPDHPFFDYASLVEQLEQTVGGENLLVLLHEDGLEQNVLRIAGFLNVSLRFAGHHRENVKREDAITWRGVHWPLSKRWIVKVRKAVDLRWPDALRRVVAPPLKATAAIINKLARRRTNLKGVVQIQLSSKLADEIRGHYGPSNERLAELLGRDLKALGY